MEQKRFTVAVIGCGARGCDTYAAIMSERKEDFQIVSLCDINPEKTEKYGKMFGVDESNRFTDEEEFFKARRADALVIATLDADHTRQCVKAMELGYRILVEKPLTANEADCEALLSAQKKYGGSAMVCHVLRYAPGYRYVAFLLDSGAIGRLTGIQTLEQVAYWHQAHSYVRGNWRRTEDTTPMILAKCCHDLDLLQYYAKSRCKSLSSTGALTFFKAENAPQSAAKRCLDCPLCDSCAYSAKRIYIEGWKQAGSPANCWPYNVLTLAVPQTEAALYEAVKTGEYGRCVFACDNDAVDYQQTSMEFENGVRATLTMTAFTASGGRETRFFGTQGDIIFDEEKGLIDCRPFGKEWKTVKIGDLVRSNGKGYAHGGGDDGLIDAFYRMLCGDGLSETSLEKSIESHLMGIRAEQSRLSGGKLLSVH